MVDVSPLIGVIMCLSCFQYVCQLTYTSQHMGYCKCFWRHFVYCLPCLPRCAHVSRCYELVLALWSCVYVPRFIHDHVWLLDTKIFASVFQFLFVLDYDATQASGALAVTSPHQTMSSVHWICSGCHPFITPSPFRPFSTVIRPFRQQRLDPVWFFSGFISYCMRCYPLSLPRITKVFANARTTRLLSSHANRCPLCRVQHEHWSTFEQHQLIHPGQADSQWLTLYIFFLCYRNTLEYGPGGQATLYIMFHEIQKWILAVHICCFFHVAFLPLFAIFYFFVIQHVTACLHEQGPCHYVHLNFIIYTFSQA